MGFLAFVVFLALVMALQARAEMALAFPDQLCGYCPMGIHWDRHQHYWVHENGHQRAPTPGITRIDHAAVPYGIVSF